MPRPLRVDHLGIGLSLVCALHCLAIPVLFAVLPSLHLALHSFQSPMRGWAIALLRLQTYDRTLVVLALAVAVLALGLGWLRHRRAAVLVWLPLAAVAFYLGLAAQRGQGSWHLAGLVGGSVLLIAGHVHNLRILRRATAAVAAGRM